MDLPLVAELKRRRVFRALVGYGIAAFAVLQIIEPVMHGLHWPESVLSYVVVALAAGFPVVVALAWIFDVKAGRVERTPPLDTSGLRGRRLVVLLLGIGALAAAPGLIWYFLLRGIASPTQRQTAEQQAPSIAVLAFADMSPGKDQEYFSDGIAEEILNALAHVDGLRVIGRTSSFSFKGKNVDLRTIGRELNAGALLEGSVRKASNKVRITLQLVNAADGLHLWSETYDRDLSDVLAVQNEIAVAVADAMRVKLAVGRRAPVVPRRVSPEAHVQYMLGHQLWLRNMHANAIAAYDKALEIDRSYAAAWAGMGKALKDLGEKIGTLAARRDGCRRGLEAVDEAVRLDPALAEGYSARALLRYECFWRMAEAQEDANRALALSPGDAASQRRYAVIQVHAGRIQEGIAGFRKTLEMDPLDPFAWNWLATAYMAAGQYDAAEQAKRRAVEILPELDSDTYLLGSISLLRGRPQAALEQLARVKSPAETDRLWLLAIANHDLGRTDESQKALDALATKFPAGVVAYGVAVVYAWRGQRDRAFEWLDRAYSEHDDGLSNVKWDPFLRKVRDDSRYAELLRKMNLPLD